MTRTETAAERLGATDGQGSVIRPTLERTPWVEQHDPRFRAIVEAVERHGTGLRVLDVGGAPYYLTNQLLGSPAVSDLEVIDRGERGGSGFVRLPNGTVPFINCNVETDQWPVDQSAYDIIVMGALIEHLFRPAHALHQARMAVREGDGRLILSTPNGVRLKRRLETLAGGSPDDGFPVTESNGIEIYNRHQHEYSRSELRDLLTKSGWHTHPDDVQSLQLARNGLTGWCYRRAAAIRETWGDQWIVDAHAGTRWVGRPDVYRQGVTDRHE